MTAVTLLWSSLFAFIAAGIYAFVGTRLRARPVGAIARPAADAFALWWVALGVSTVVTGVGNLLAAYGVDDVAVFATISQVNVLIVCVALWALVYYLLFLFTGTRGFVAPLTAFYVAYYALLVYYLASSDPVGVDVKTWQAGVRYAKPLQGGFFAVIVILLVLPQIVGALAYFTLYFRLTEPAQRYRVALVSWAIVVWFTSALAAGLTETSAQSWWPLVSRLIGLTAAGTVLLAYYPPAWIRRRLGAGGNGPEPAPPVAEGGAAQGGSGS